MGRALKRAESESGGGPERASVPAISGRHPHDRFHAGWERSRNWPALLLIVALHAGALWGLMQLDAVREAVKDIAPIMVGMITLPPPEPPKPRIEPPPPPKPVPRKPRPEPQMIAAETPAPAPMSAPLPEPVPVEEPPPPPPPAPAEPAPVIPPNFVAAYLDNPPPVYPPVAKRLGETGLVMLRVLVNVGGRADSVDVEKSSGFSRLDRAAIDAVRKWKFVPARQGENNVAAWVLVPINFEINNP